MLDKVRFDINDQVIVMDNNIPKRYFVDSISIESTTIVYNLKTISADGSYTKNVLKRSSDLVYKDPEELIEKMYSYLGIKVNLKTKKKDGKASEKSPSETESTDS